MLCKMDLHQNNQAYLIAYTSTLIAPLQRVRVCWENIKKW